jgi:tripartite-type tricarboxylate transporter receptor subunit TctC
VTHAQGFKTLGFAALAAAWILVAGIQGPAKAASVADFYKNKTVRFGVGANTGGGYDAYIRLLASHMARHLPGRPTVVVVNMPGAGGTKATNYVYNVAPKDGTHTIMPFFNHPVFQLIRPKGIKFDVRRMLWIGNMASLNSVLAVFHKAPVRSLADAKKSDLILSASGKGSETYIYPTLAGALTGARIRLVLGYRGTANMTVAMERGEVHGRGGSYMSWSSLRPDWVRDRKALFLVQAGLRKHPDLPNVPLMQELAKTPDEKAVVRLLSLPFLTSRAIAFPPGVPDDRLAAFRTAFDATMKDPRLLADAKKRRMDITPGNGQAVAAAIASMFKTSPAIIARAREMLKY